MAANSIVLVNQHPLALATNNHVAGDASSQPYPKDQDNATLNRTLFDDLTKQLNRPPLLFGSGTSAMQVEGAYASGGKGLSIWDDMSMRNPGIVADGSNTSVTCRMYELYKEDIKSMARMGFTSYRFSFAWPRIVPGGRVANGVNKEGIAYYNDLIDTIIENKLKPFATIFHFDIPLRLEAEYKGFLDKQIRLDFREYSRILFWEFGDRVKYWTTINEPWTYSVRNYVTAISPSEDEKRIPGGRSFEQGKTDAEKNKTRNAIAKERDHSNDPFICTRNMLLAHAEAVDLYRTEFQQYQLGEIGIVLNSHWYEPYNPDNPNDVKTAKRAMDFMIGWFLEPILYGRYPKGMTDSIPAERLVPFSEEEQAKLKGSIDFLGLNYYTSYFAEYDPSPPADEDAYYAYQNMKYHYHDVHGNPAGEATGADWLLVAPGGLYKHLKQLKNDHGDALKSIYITENGMADADARQPPQVACIDTQRVKYHQDHLANLYKAIKDTHVDVKGYFAWSWCDNFEFAAGFTQRFGIMYVDYVNNQNRYPKASALWLGRFLLTPVAPEWPPKSAKKRAIEDGTGGADKRPKTS